MPTHFHLVVKQQKDNGISQLMHRTLNSYARYFNLKHKRKGHLWQDRFKSVLVKTEGQLLHLTRYIHLNPTSANLIKDPREWPYSSFNEYLNGRDEPSICDLKDWLTLKAEDYRKFVLDRISFQRELEIIKHHFVD